MRNLINTTPFNLLTMATEQIRTIASAYNKTCLYDWISQSQTQPWDFELWRQYQLNKQRNY